MASMASHFEKAMAKMQEFKMMSRCARKQNRKSLKRADYCLRQSRRALRLIEANLGSGKKIVAALLTEAVVGVEK